MRFRYFAILSAMIFMVACSSNRPVRTPEDYNSSNPNSDQYTKQYSNSNEATNSFSAAKPSDTNADKNSYSTSEESEEIAATNSADRTPANKKKSKKKRDTLKPLLRRFQFLPDQVM